MLIKTAVQRTESGMLYTFSIGWGLTSKKSISLLSLLANITWNELIVSETEQGPSWIRIV
jgi:hypothetical protein